MKAGLHKAFVTLGYLLAVLVIGAALLTSVFSLVNPWLNDHRDRLERLASGMVGKTVTVGEAGITWDMLEPVLTVSGVTVSDPASQKALVVFSRIKVRLAIWRSLLHWQWQPERLELLGAEVTLPSQPASQSILQALSLTPATKPVLAWVLSEPDIVLRDISFYLKLPHGEVRRIWLEWLHLESGSRKHALEAILMLPQEIPTTGHLAMVWHDDAPLSPHHIRLAMELQGLSLSQWVQGASWQGVRIQGGQGNLSLWADWKAGAWQRIQGITELYNLVLQSPVGKERTITRFSGNLGWRRLPGGKQQLAGADILIDLPAHLWPYTHFSMISTPSLAEQPSSLRVESGYLDLGDSIDWLTTFGLLPDRLQKGIASLKLSGAIDGVKATIDGEKLQKGILTLNSHDVVLTLDQVLTAPLSLSVLSGEMSWGSDAGGTSWLMGHSLQAVNDDGEASAELYLRMPAKGSPAIRLSGTFSMQHGEHIAHYLPLRIFNPALAKWLVGAFRQGSVKDGHVLLRGILADFPFDHNEGVFRIYGSVNDVDLHFASGWPDIQHASGELAFSARKMLANMRSGEFQKFRLQSVQAVIPRMGMGNPVLSLSGRATLDVKGGRFDFQDSQSRLVISDKGIASGDFSSQVSSNAGWRMTNGVTRLTLKMRPDASRKIFFNYGDLSGDVQFLSGSVSGGVKIHIPRLSLNPLGKNMTDILHPTEFPAVRLDIDDLKFGKLRLGQLELSLKPITGGTGIDRLDIHSPLFQTHATGEWVKAGSHFSGMLETAHTDQLLAAFGEGSDNFKAGPGKVQFDLFWLGGPADFSLKSVSGSVSILIGKGVITHLDQETTNKMGLGRMLSVFSLQTLPRRLSLDFSDLFENGYSFDSIQGDFKLKGGSAVTQNAKLKGVVAQVGVTGRLGFVAHDYNLRMDISPHVTSSLPVVAAIATANPLAGVAAWMVDKAVSPEVNKMAMYRYQITGTWEHPVWQKVGAPAS